MKEERKKKRMEEQHPLRRKQKTKRNIRLAAKKQAPTPVDNKDWQLIVFPENATVTAPFEQGTRRLKAVVVQLTTLTSITHNWKGERTLSSIWNLTVTVKFSKLMLSAVIISTFNRTV